MQELPRFVSFSYQQGRKTANITLQLRWYLQWGKKVKGRRKWLSGSWNSTGGEPEWRFQSLSKWRVPSIWSRLRGWTLWFQKHEAQCQIIRWAGWLLLLFSSGFSRCTEWKGDPIRVCQRIADGSKPAWDKINSSTESGEISLEKKE